jgi:endonuclease III
MSDKPPDALEVIRRLEKAYPNAKIGLLFSNPLELLVAVILSAQSTDVGVNKLTPALFSRYHTVTDYAEADISELENLIHSAGFYHNKAKSIKGAARVMIEKFDGNVPRTMGEITTLPGVARKTGNIVLYNAYGVIAGIAVDTHVRRVSQRLGLTEQDDPEKIELDLTAKVPRSKWGKFPYLLIDHGRAVCIARKPKHDVCVLKDICPSAGI